MSVDPRLFALDQNFPTPIVDVLQEFTEEAELIPLNGIDERLTTLEDWAVLHALHRHDRPWDGLVTTDSSMVLQTEALSLLCQTKLTLVVALGAGHDPILATGLLFAHLPGICKRTTPEVAQLWELRAVQRAHTDPWRKLEALAERRGEHATQLYKLGKLSTEDFDRDPLA